MYLTDDKGRIAMNDQTALATNIVTINGVEYRLISLSYDGTWYNVIKTKTEEATYLNADTVEASKNNTKS